MTSYKYIFNPETNNKVRINSKLGREILRKYLNYINTTSVQIGGKVSAITDGEVKKWDEIVIMLEKDIRDILKVRAVEREIIDDGIQFGGSMRSDNPEDIHKIIIEGPGYIIQGGEIISATKEGWERGKTALEKLREAATRNTKTPGSKDGDIWTPPKNPGDKLGFAGNNYNPLTIAMVLTYILYGFEKSSRGVYPRAGFRDAVNPGYTYYRTMGNIRTYNSWIRG